LDRRVRRLLRQPGKRERAGIVVQYRGNPELIQGGDRFDVEHHPGQFFTYLNMAEVSLDTRLDFPGGPRTLGDLYQNWLRTLRPDGEMSYVVNAVVSYRPAGSGWTNKFGQHQQLGPYVERLRRYPELVCDESHMMMALTRLSADRRWLKDPTVAAQWSAVGEVLTTKVRILRSRQERDGRFPIHPEVRAGDNRLALPDWDARVVIHYTGHHLEWLTLALTEQELREDWILRAVDRLLSSIEAEYPAGDYYRRLLDFDDCFAVGNFTHAVSGLSRWRDKAGRLDN